MRGNILVGTIRWLIYPNFLLETLWPIWPPPAFLFEVYFTNVHVWLSKTILRHENCILKHGRVKFVLIYCFLINSVRNIALRNLKSTCNLNHCRCAAKYITTIEGTKVYDMGEICPNVSLLSYISKVKMQSILPNFHVLFILSYLTSVSSSTKNQSDYTHTKHKMVFIP